ncbi:MAG TPA: heavy metal translocating P-type ATPase [Bacillota bacterium]|nr:heavy metal translocating P-type ATPase [Bacillota bacterium]
MGGAFKKKFILKGLGCANCAAKIEDNIGRLDAVNMASVNFAEGSLTIELAGKDRYPQTLAQIRKMVDSIEPGVKVSDHDGAEDQPKFFTRERIYLVVGILLFLGGILAPQGRIKPALYIVSYLVIGGGVLSRAAKNILGGRVFDENFLMAIATIGAIAIGEYPEAVSVMLFYRIGEQFQDAAVNRSRRSIKSLMNIKPDKANLLIGGQVRTISPGQLNVGDTIVVRPGERVPVDSRVLEGSSELDVSALTGESMPESVEAGDQVLSGSINTSGALTLAVEKLFTDSTVSRIIDLVENASGRKAPTEQFITRFARVYTPIVVFAAIGLATIPPLVLPAAVFSDWLYRALVFLVISCPCALVISIPLSFFGGIGGASRRGILVKGGSSLEALKDVATVVFDKTGTLTKGEFAVVGLKPAHGITKDRLLDLAALGEYHSNHPIARSILLSYGKEIDPERISSYEEIPGKGIKAVVEGETLLVGNIRLMRDHNTLPPKDNSTAGIASKAVAELAATSDDTLVHVAYAGSYHGFLEIGDNLKEDSRSAVEKLRSLGVNRLAILSGDRQASVQYAAERAGITEYYHGLLPHEKVEKLEQIMEDKGPGKVAFVGDGINDAPVLARADVGIAMGGIGSDTAVEAADVVLMTDEPTKVAEGIALGRRTHRIVMQNVFMALSIKIIVLLLGLVGLAGMWEAVFADVGAALIAVFNSMRVVKK